MNIIETLNNLKIKHEEIWNTFLKVLSWIAFFVLGIIGIIKTGSAGLWFLFVPLLIIFISVIITAIARLIESDMY